MTIGYGAPTNDIFYGGCSSMATLLTLEVRNPTAELLLEYLDTVLTLYALCLAMVQSFAGIFLDSICIGMFYARFSRANVRMHPLL